MSEECTDVPRLRPQGDSRRITKINKSERRIFFTAKQSVHDQRSLFADQRGSLRTHVWISNAKKSSNDSPGFRLNH